MINSYPVVRSFARCIREIITNGHVVEVFSNSPQQCYLWIEKDNQVYTLAFDFSSQALFFRLHHEVISKSKTWNPQFKSSYGSEIQSVNAHYFDRSFSIKTNEGNFIFKAYGAAANIVWIPFHGEIEIFRKNRKNDLLTQLDSFQKDPDVFPEFFWSEKMAQKSVLLFGVERLQNAAQNHGWKWEKNKEQLWNLVPDVHTDQDFCTVLLEGVGPCLAAIKKLERWNHWKKSVKNQYQSLTKRLVKVETRWLELQEGSRNEEWGHLILSNLTQIYPGSTEVEVEDYFRGGRIKISLKKDLLPQQNAERLFAKAKNEKLEIDFVEEDLSRIQQRLTVVEQSLKIIQEGVISDALLKGWEQQVKKEVQADLFPFLRFEKDGFDIWVGKNAANNDELLRQAKSNDLWLHAYGSGGSHVVIKMPRKKALPKSVLEFAASLAAKYSKQKGSDACPVQFTERKFVRKPKKADPGLVTVERFETILVDWRENL
jgi:hypothetical protein